MCGRECDYVLLYPENPLNDFGIRCIRQVPPTSISRLPLAPLGYASPTGEKPKPSSTETLLLKINSSIKPEKESTPYPLPSGEGQVTTPINQLNQGEVHIHLLFHLSSHVLFMPNNFMTAG